MAKRLTESEVMGLIRKKAENRKAVEVARELGISQQYLSDILNGRRSPGPTVIEKLGLQRVYEKVTA